LTSAVHTPVWAVLPFVLYLLLIAVLPLFLGRLWEPNRNKLALALAAGTPVAIYLIRFHPTGVRLLAESGREYLAFMALIGALFVISGGIYLRGSLAGTPLVNTAFLTVGAVLASVVGTTGASALLIRPLLRANASRAHTRHLVVLFIFVVANGGGMLTPLGDPPLFLGFLKGVDFFWTAKNIFPDTLFVVGALLALFYALDRWYFRHEGVTPFDPTPDTGGIGFDGAVNFWLLGGVLFLVLMSGIWKSPVGFEIMGTRIGLPGLVRDVGLVALTLLSLKVTATKVHADNQFGWGPMAEVAKLFAGIFLTIVPVIAMLKAGLHGPFGAIVSAVTRPDGQPDPAMYFWATGILSSFLDNAPTYLVFFNTAGGDPQALMTTYATTLAAISAGAVFMGANTYIGNAPNLMVKAIAESRGVRMPSFFGYMLWSGAILLPLFILATFIFFR
jgi:Na+/H+ antiporter NhaD/arsenite permease-like protein